MRKIVTGLLPLFMAMSAMASTTGGLIGRVTDQNGEPLPGATITATSPALMGQKTSISDVDGNFRLLLLPPGKYDLKFYMSGFQTITRKDIQVQLGHQFEVNQVLSPDKLEETIVVVAEQQLIDSSSTTTGENWSTEYVESIPTERNVGSILSITPGVTRQEGPSGGMVIAGASGTESSYIIDGMNTTEIENGTQGKQMNFDFIEEIQIKTGGYEAEYGRATGGVVNMLTKSGGNQFSGSMFYYMKNKSMASDGEEPWFGSSYLGRDEFDFGATIGGPIIKDKLWFFIAYNPTTSEDFRQNNDNVVRMRNGQDQRKAKSERDYWSAKLTYNINENNTLVFSSFADPEEKTQELSGEKTNDRVIKSGGTDWIIKYDSIVNQNLVVSAQYGVHNETSRYHSVDGNDLSQIYDRFNDSEYGRRGGIGYGENSDRSRDTFKTSLEWFLGKHDIKFGYDLEHNVFHSQTRYSGDALYRYQDLGDSVYVRRRVYAYEDPNGEIVDIFGDRAHYRQVKGDWLKRNTETDNQNLFLQDKWDVTDNFMVSYGVRLEQQKINGNHPVNGGKFTAIDIKDMLAPRIGMTWDMFGDGKSKLYAHYGKFYSSIPLDINNRAFAEEILFFDYWILPKASMESDFFDFDPDNYNWNYDFENGNLPNIFTSPSGVGGAAPVADDLKAFSQDEIILGYDYLLTDLISIGGKYTKRSLNEIVEDISFNHGTSYIIANPGEDLAFTANTDLDFIDATGKHQMYSAGDRVEMTAEEVGFAKPERDYSAFEFSVKRKFFNNWTANLSVIKSELKGNYIGGELPFYGQTDPGITAAYDLPSTLVNTEGAPLPFDRPWQIKSDGMYVFNWGGSIGWQYSYMDGTPIGAYGDPDGPNADGTTTGYYGEFRLIKNGAGGRTPGVSSLDLNFSYTLNLKSKGSLTGYVYVFNVFDSQKALEVNQRYSFDKPSIDYLIANHGGSYENYIKWIDGRFNTLDELNAHMAEAGMERYEHWSEPEVLQTPRYMRLGIKWSF